MQHSVASDNQILSAGNSAPAAMSLDPLFPTSQDSCTPGNPDATAYQPSFAGASFENNHFWTGPNTHYVIGQAVGSAAWFMSSTYGAYTGTGGNITGNDNNNIPTNEGTGILVAGIIMRGFRETSAIEYRCRRLALP